VRETVSRVIMLAAVLLVACWPATAQTAYPERPVHLIVGFPAGSSVDLVARLIAPRLSDALGKPFIVENVPGAAGNLASERVAKAAPDGHTLAVAANGQIINNPSLYRLTFDPVRDFAPVTQLTSLPNVLVVANGAPFKTFPELIAAAKAHPGEITYASGGVGGSPHLAGALLNSLAGTDIRHIPYKGAVAALPDILAGRVTMMFSPASIVMPTVREGRLRALAVTSAKRSSAMPDLPAIAEFGLTGFDVTVWLGLLAPAGTPNSIIRKVYLESVKALALPDVREKLKSLGMDCISNSPGTFYEIIQSEIPVWAKVIRDARIAAD
jgi:tripartite-type tricarboxylate transporter receptor subunit TctC